MHDNICVAGGRICWRCSPLRCWNVRHVCSSRSAFCAARTLCIHLTWLECVRMLLLLLLCCPSPPSCPALQVFMYTMYNSPAPALRDLTDFYRSELNTKTIQVGGWMDCLCLQSIVLSAGRSCSCQHGIAHRVACLAHFCAAMTTSPCRPAVLLQFVPGPDNNTLTLIRLLSDGWDLCEYRYGAHRACWHSTHEQSGAATAVIAVRQALVPASHAHSAFLCHFVLRLAQRLCFLCCAPCAAVPVVRAVRSLCRVCRQHSQELRGPQAPTASSGLCDAKVPRRSAGVCSGGLQRLCGEH